MYSDKYKFIKTPEKIAEQKCKREYELAYLIVVESIKKNDSIDQITNENFLYLLNLAGNIALVLNKIDSAHHWFEKALNEDPTSWDACIGLAEILFIKKNYEGAKILFEISYNGNNTRALTGFNKVNLAITEKNEITYGEKTYEEDNTMFEWVLKNRHENNFAVNSLEKIISILGYKKIQRSLVKLSQ